MEVSGGVRQLQMTLGVLKVKLIYFQAHRDAFIEKILLYLSEIVLLTVKTISPLRYTDPDRTSVLADSAIRVRDIMARQLSWQEVL